MIASGQSWKIQRGHGSVWLAMQFSYTKHHMYASIAAVSVHDLEWDLSHETTPVDQPLNSCR